MAKLALIVALIALAVAILAYQEAGGIKDLGKRVETLREETANGLARVEKALRPLENPTGDKSKPKQ